MRSNKMILQIYTIIHTLISLVAIFTGFVVLLGLLTGNRVDRWTKWFLISAVATTVTGFFFPFHGITPAIKVGIISSVVLLITIYARYARHLAGAWRGIYVVGASPCSLFQCLCRNRAAIRKNPRADSDGADTKRAAI
jgi:hypothetical protein